MSHSCSTRLRKRVQAEFRRGPDGSGFTQCHICKKVLPAAIADMHDCQRDAKINSSLECHYTIDSAVKEQSQLKSRKRKYSDVGEAARNRNKGSKTPKTDQKSRDPNKPKKPKTSFFLFMDDFRNKFKDTKCTAATNKEGADVWKRMTEEEKKPYALKYEELKQLYLLDLAKYEESIRKANEEGDSAEVGKVDTERTSESLFGDHSYAYEESESLCFDLSHKILISKEAIVSKLIGG